MPVFAGSRSLRRRRREHYHRIHLKSEMEQVASGLPEEALVLPCDHTPSESPMAGARAATLYDREPEDGHPPAFRHALTLAPAA